MKSRHQREVAQQILSREVGYVRKPHANRLRVKQVIHLPEIRLVASAARPESRGGEASTTTGSGPKPGATYTVRRGDTLPGIAKSAWGTIERWPELLCVNYEIIENPDRLSAGTRLRIPR